MKSIKSLATLLLMLAGLAFGGPALAGDHGDDAGEEHAGESAEEHDNEERDGDEHAGEAAEDEDEEEGDEHAGESW